MNRVIEIHDSTLEKIVFSGAQAELLFSSVYIHQSKGTPGVDAGTGWVQRAILRIDSAVMQGTFAKLPSDLTYGTISMDENRAENEIPIPLKFKGTFGLTLMPMWQDGETVSFTGIGAELELIGQAEYVEEFRP